MGFLEVMPGAPLPPRNLDSSGPRAQPHFGLGAAATENKRFNLSERGYFNLIWTALRHAVPGGRPAGYQLRDRPCLQLGDTPVLVTKPAPIRVFPNYSQMQH